MAFDETKLLEFRRLANGGVGVHCPACGAAMAANIEQGQVSVTCPLPHCGYSARWPASTEPEALRELLAEVQRLTEIERLGKDVVAGHESEQHPRPKEGCATCRLADAFLPLVDLACTRPAPSQLRFRCSRCGEIVENSGKTLSAHLWRCRPAG
jgi:hypothetical protein